MLRKSLRTCGAATGTRGGRAFLFFALLPALVGFAFAAVVRNEFILVDDVDYLVNNLRLREGFTAANLRWAFTTDFAANWFPLTWLSHLLDYRLFGLDAGAHHLMSLGLHAANTVLLFAVLRAMTGRSWCSALVAALFGIHPLHVESVAWAAYRKDVLSGFFWVLALGAYLGYARRPGRGRYLAVLGLFALGLMAKPAVVTLPFLLLLLDWWPLGRLAGRGDAPASLLCSPIARATREKIPLFLLAAATSVVTYRAQKAVGTMAYFQDLSLQARIANALVSYVAYLRQTVWPRDLAVFYPHPVVSLPAWQPLAAAIFLAAVLLLAFAARRRRPWLAVGWLWYLGTLLPMIGLVQVGLQARADRYTYLPLAGIFVMLVWGAAEWSGRRLRSVATVFALLMLAVLSILCRRQVAIWRDTLTLFTHAAAVTERNWMAENNIGAAWGQRGDNMRAMEHFQRALAYRPDYPEALFNYRKAVIREAMIGSGHPGTAPQSDPTR